ncbi:MULTISPECIES: hypothetical protein [unclassified Actinotalea]|uniref:hypothetical protein n=1 Tax=unclassified Actinotalea TaxID=2638618 RepID=UPI0015F5B8D1|nr:MULTISPECIES: hypothetical protein [unclassified Actinotalea]
MTTVALSRSRSGSRVLRASAQLLRRHAVAWAWYWVLLAAVVVVMARTPLRVEVDAAGMWSTVDSAPRWFAFAMLLSLVPSGLAAHVANGLTRRAFADVLVAVAVVTALAGGVAWAVGAAVEAAVTDTTGRPVLPLILEAAAHLAAYGAAGTLVGAVYYRAGAWWGTLTLPLTVGPAVAAETWVASGWQGEVGAALGWPSLTGPATTLLPVGVAALLLLATRMVLSRAAIHRPGS